MEDTITSCAAPPVLGTHNDTAMLAVIGLIGGMSWRSTMLYYERINQDIESSFTDRRCARVVVGSLDYASLLRAAEAGRWDRVERAIVETGQWLERSGCTVIALTAVTAHLSHAALGQAVGVAVPHVLAAAAAQLDQLRIIKVGVLGTARACGSNFVRERLVTGGPREILVVPQAMQEQIDRMIHERLSMARIVSTDRDLLREAIEALRRQGAQAVVLACTELPLLLPLPPTFDMPLVIDAVALHARAICDLVLKVDRS